MIETDFTPPTARLPARLPGPPPLHTDWPWTAAAPPLPQALPNGRPWPRISVITPSYNQSQFLEQTLRSVLLQGYPNLEYIVIDGGSTDDSVEIIRRYEQHLYYWVSEKDRGQSHAINKGFQRATGDILCWLNSDDYFLPGTLRTVAVHLEDPNGAMALAGNCLVVYTDGRPPREFKAHYQGRRRLLEFWKGYDMHQPGVFWRRAVYEKVGLLDENLHYTMDFDYWARIARHYCFRTIDEILACATAHADAKTGDNYVQYYRALDQSAPRYWGSKASPDYWYLKVSYSYHQIWRHRWRHFLFSLRRVGGKGKRRLGLRTNQGSKRQPDGSNYEDGAI